MFGRFSLSKKSAQHSVLTRSARRNRLNAIAGAEHLEDRRMLAILFRDNNPIPATVDLGGAVIQPAHVELVFWGSAYSGATTPSIASVTTAVNGILGTAATPGPYTSALSQYRSGLGPANVVGSVTVTTSSPAATFTNAQVNAFLTGAINAGTLPSPASDPQLLYMVITQPGSTDPTEGLGGEHSNGSSTFGNFRYGWTRDNGTLDDVTYFFSHELVEAETDPAGGTIQVVPTNPTSWNEIGDNAAQNFSYRLGGTLVQSYLSNLDRAYIVPTGQTQNFTVENGVLKIDGDQKSANVNDAITIALDATGKLQATLNGETATFDAGVITGLDVNGGAGDDTLTVDFTNGNPIPAGQLAFHGGLGNNTLKMMGGTETAESYSPGLDNSSGRIDITVGGTARSITFESLAPIVDVVAGPLVVNGTAASNAINYTQGSVTTNGLVTVDNFESIEFSNKTTLTINGGAGDDNININNPSKPTGLTSIIVNGGDPTASDKLIVTATSGSDTIGYNPTAIGAGNVTIAGQPTTNFTNTELVTIDGNGGTDALTVSTPAGVDADTYTPGDAADSGTIAVRVAGSGTALVPLTFLHLGASGTTTLAKTGGGRSDALELNGTSNSDTFNVGSSDIIQIVGLGSAFVTRLLSTPGINGVILRGLAGDDIFNVNAGNAYASGVIVDGGDPSASDTLNFTGTGTSAVTLDYAAGTIAQTGQPTVTCVGVELINANAAGQNFTASGTSGNDSLTVTPTSATAATLRMTSTSASVGSVPVVNASSIGTTFTVDLLAGSDNLTVEGTQASEAITVNSTTVTVGALKTVTYANTENLQVLGQAGNDTFDVTPSNTTTIFIDGGDPIGSTPGDQLTLHPTGAFSIEPGPLNDKGGLKSAAQRVSWDHIEGLTVVGGGPALVLGTNADDDITVIARNSDYNALADGVQDFTVSVNQGPDVLYINQPNLFIDALAGDDDIVVREPAPVGGVAPVWNTQVTVAGGTPAVNSGPLGDTLQLETPGQQSVTYTPTGIDTGTLNDTTNTSVITMGSFTIPALPYTSSPGGIEHVIYQGLGGNDALTVMGTAGIDVFTHTPGARGDEGNVQVNKLLPLDYTGLGSTGAVTLNGNGGADNTLVYQGTANPDNFTVEATTGAVTLTTGSVTHVQVRQQVTGANTINHLELHALGGVNSFNVAGTLPYSTTLLDGGLGSSFDPVNLTAASSAVIVNLGDSTLSTDTTVSGYGGLVTLAGTDVANLDVNSQTLTVNGTSQSDSISYTPSGVSSGTFSNAGLATVFNFTNATSTFTIAGGSGGLADTVNVIGSDTRDTFAISQPSRTVQVTTNGIATKTVTLANSITTLSAQGKRGQDTFQVVPGPGVVGQTRDNLLINVDGGATSGENDALVVSAANLATLPATSFVTVNRGQDLTSGTVRVFENAVADPDINYVNVETVSPLVAGTNLNPNLLIMGPDTGEPNNNLGNATFVGSGPNLQILHASVFPSSTEFPGVPSDFDYYRVVADKTGTLDFQVYFKVFSTALLPNGGALDIAVFDGAGNLVASAGSSIAEVFGSVGANGNARVKIPAVQGQSYYLGVTGATNAAQSLSVNGYDVTVINTPAVVPATLELSRSTTGITGAAGVPDTGDLPANASPDDTGRSQFDNVTKTNNPTIYIRVDDAFLLQDVPGNQTTGGVPGMGSVAIPFNSATTLTSTTPGFRVALFDGGNGAPAAGNAHTLDANDSTFLGFAQPVAGVPHLYALKIGSQGADSLADGLHNLTSRVQIIDPALAATPTARGFGDRSVALQITVDTVVPPVFFGPTEGANGNGLAPASDSGVVGQPATFTDKITNITTPTFFGTAEADAIIRVYADLDGNPATTNDQTLLGKTVAIPLDGTNAFPRGQWSLQTLVDLNNPAIFPKDGIRHILATAEDLAGNVSSAAAFDILIDTSGPQITNVEVGGSPNYNLFGLKPGNADQGPTPLTSSLVIDVQDFPAFTAAFAARNVAFIKSIAETPGIYVVKGDHVGIVSIDHITAQLNTGVDGQALTGTVTLVFSKPLADDRYTLTVLDSGIIDLAGNKLDGESNAAEPNGAPTFPTGDGQPGTNFVARFTIDTRPELAAYAAQTVSVDINGNQVWDPHGVANDASNVDLQFTLQVAPGQVYPGTAIPVGQMSIHDSVFTGNFGPVGIDVRGANGFDKLAAYGYDSTLGAFRWLIDVNGDGIIDQSKGDIVTVQPVGFQINGQPVTGNFDGNTANGSDIALFDGTTWWFDTNHDFVINQADVNNGGKYTSRIAGYPITGDFDGNGFTDLGTWKDNKFYFDMASGVRTFGAFAVQTINFGFPGVNEKPVAADMDHDGITDVGLFVPGRTTTVPQELSQWYFLLSNDFTKDEVTNEVIPASHAQYAGTVNALNHAFSPSPLGQDLYAEIFDEFALPLVGNFDPPTLTRNVVASPQTSSLGHLLGGTQSAATSSTSDQLYSFDNLRDASATISLSGTGTSGATVTVYDAAMTALATGTGGAPVQVSAPAGQKLIVRVHGATGATTVNIANSVPDSDLLDVSRDKLVTALDALQVINFLNSHAADDNSSLSSDRVYLDTSLDGIISALDALRIINHLNAVAAQTLSGSGLTPLSLVTSATDSAAASDAVFAALAMMDSGNHKTNKDDDLFG
jgi:hypothetical protein